MRPEMCQIRPEPDADRILPGPAELDEVTLTLVSYASGAAKADGNHTPVRIIYELHHPTEGCVARYDTWTGQGEADGLPGLQGAVHEAEDN